MTATTQTQYGHLMGAQLMINGTVCPIPDTNIAAIVGANRSASFSGDFSFVLPGAGLLSFRNGTTYPLPAAVLAALTAAHAPCTIL